MLTRWRPDIHGGRTVRTTRSRRTGGVRHATRPLAAPAAGCQKLLLSYPRTLGECPSPLPSPLPSPRPFMLPSCASRMQGPRAVPYRCPSALASESRGHLWYSIHLYYSSCTVPPHASVMSVLAIEAGRSVSRVTHLRWSTTYLAGEARGHPPTASFYSTRSLSLTHPSVISVLANEAGNSVSLVTHLR
jgi:hypothetical protein